ncbi:MAG: GH3 auxin-responsive promoter family protein [Bacillota bacterium]|nr:GH3 auxin-responsive promoter family protein [Bacillota bacterium]
MSLKEKLKQRKYDEIWQEYCGFFDLDISEYMTIQKRLMLEQIGIWSNSALGQSIIGKKNPETIEEFLAMIPLTTYEDYAEMLLYKRDDLLPEHAILWLQTTWEGGVHPIKVAPYTKGMLDTYKNNIIAGLIICTSTEKGKFNISPKDKALYGFAPLPFMTGLIPHALDDIIGLEFLPPIKEAEKMSFSQRNKVGFKLGFAKGIDFFFGMGSVAYYISKSLSSMGSGSGSKDTEVKYSPAMLIKIMKAKHRCKKEGRPLKPRDVFKLKGFVCAGTDNECYKDELEELWGIRPTEIFAGTEPTIIGVESWNKSGLYFFPDACFYEFIPEAEMTKNFEDKEYQPKTVLMDQVVPGERYELAVSVFKGGAFMRYRVGDVYQCLGLSSSEDGTKIPRFRYIDRMPDVIDIAGFTRITENSINNVIELSGLPITDWIAVKEFTKNNKPFLHMYVEIKPSAFSSNAISSEIIREHMKVYFKYVDSDYNDLKQILGLEPLEITIVRCGTFEEYHSISGKKLRRVNPALTDIKELLKTQDTF